MKDGLREYRQIEVPIEVFSKLIEAMKSAN